MKVICFSKTGERAVPFMRQAARDYWAYASFGMVLWREEDSSFWWNMYVPQIPYNDDMFDSLSCCFSKEKSFSQKRIHVIFWLLVSIKQRIGTLYLKSVFCLCCKEVIFKKKYCDGYENGWRTLSCSLTVSVGVCSLIFQIYYTH